MSLTSEFRTLYHLLFARVRGGSHQERLEAFYRHQADGYDAFRKRLLHGREKLIQALDMPAGGHLLDMGGGTGANIEYLGDRRQLLDRITIVDLCAPLLARARERIASNGWTNVRTVLADVTRFEPEDGPVDVITFSYSLTMIPDWFAALERAYALLKPGGTIGVVDFYISRKWPATGMRRHSRFSRLLWPAWFGCDNVFLSLDHLPWLQGHFETLRLEEGMGRVPYLLGMKVPYYVFVGQKVAATTPGP